MLVEKELTQEQKETNLVAFAEYLQKIQDESKKRFEKQISDKNFMKNLKIVEMKPFSEKLYVSTSAEV